MDDTKKQAIRKAIEKTMMKGIKNLQNIDIEKMALNPYLLRLLSLNSARQIAEFMVSERIERSMVTSYGSMIQSVARILADEGGTGVEGADICKIKNGRRHYVQIKSGPNTPNKDILNQMNLLLSSATRRNGGSIALLCISYGHERHVSSVIKKYSKIDWKIGIDTWEFMGDDRTTASDIFNIIVEVADKPRAPSNESYASLLKRKIDQVTKQLQEKYGDSGTSMWEKLFVDNM